MRTREKLIIAKRSVKELVEKLAFLGDDDDPLLQFGEITFLVMQTIAKKHGRKVTYLGGTFDPVTGVLQERYQFKGGNQ